MSLRLQKTRGSQAFAQITTAFPLDQETAQRLFALSDLVSAASHMKSQIEYNLVTHSPSAADLVFQREELAKAMRKLEATFPHCCIG